MVEIKKMGNVKKTLFNKVVIAGVGLMGGSLGLALKKHGLAVQVAGYVRKKSTIKEALAIGAIDFGTTSLEEAARDADLVVLAGPVSTTPELFKQMLPYLPESSLITDVGSTKAELAGKMKKIIAAANTKGKQLTYIGSHPMAGSEKTGVGASREDLYQGAVCIMVSDKNTASFQMNKIKKMWKTVGCVRIVMLSESQHDYMTAMISHVPHAAAVALTASVDRVAKKKPLLTKLISTGFKDTTRIAAGSAPMWVDIFISNKEEVIKGIKQLESELASMSSMIKNSERSKLADYLDKTRKFRIKAVK